jgi:hypothetical protein
MLNIGGCCRPRTIGAAEKMTANLHSVPDYSALAELTNGSDGLDRTFEAIERMLRTRGNCRTHSRRLRMSPYKLLHVRIRLWSTRC